MVELEAAHRGNAVRLISCENDDGYLGCLLKILPQLAIETN